MSDSLLSYREVIPEQSHVWKEISLNTGGIQSTLQDIKVSDRASGYSYRDASKYYTRNRFVYWRISHNCLDLAEHSLDLNLSGNRLRYKFSDTPLLGGISIHETFYNVIVLVPTVCSVHVLMFPHPGQLHSSTNNVFGDLSAPSIFADTTAHRNVFYVYNNPGAANAQLPHHASTWLSADATESLYLFAYPNNDLILVKLAVPESGTVSNGETLELKCDARNPKFLSGLAGKLFGRASGVGVYGGGGAQAGQLDIVDVLLLPICVDVYAVALCRDGRIQIWAVTGRTIGVCVADSDVIAFKSPNQGNAQNYMLQRALPSMSTLRGTESDNMIVVYIGTPSQPQFFMLIPRIQENQFRLECKGTIYAQNADLVDFVLCDGQLWALHRDVDNDGAQITTAYIRRPSATGDVGWLPISLEPESHPDALTCDQLDPRQAYLEYIFHPGRFPLSIISKALSIYQRSAVLADSNFSVQMLKQHISMAVEHEIQTELKETEVRDDEYLETANWCWSRFLSCCVQYYSTGLRPLGLLVMSTAGGGVILKKESFSILRPMQALEHLSLSPSISIPSQFAISSEISNDEEVSEDLMKLMDILTLIDEQLGADFKSSFDLGMFLSQAPDLVIEGMLSEDLNEVNLNAFITEVMTNSSSFSRMTHTLMQLMKSDTTPSVATLYPNLDNLEMEVEVESEGLHKSVSQVFMSALGISVVSRSLAQIAAVRYSVSRALFLFCNMLINDEKIHDVSAGDFDMKNSIEWIRNICLPDVTRLLRSCYAMHWLASGQVAMAVLPPDQTLQRLSSLKLTPAYNMKPVNQLSSSLLLELFVGSTGGSDAHRIFARSKFDDDTLANWQTSLLPYIAHLTEIIWPLNGNTCFPEWLLVTGQHLRLQQYVGLLNGWCNASNLSRSFILALSHLATGEKRKAYMLFLQNSKGVYGEPFIINRLPQLERNQGDANNISFFVQYYLKVIHLFELHGYLDCAMDAAVSILSVEDIDAAHKATLYSILFKHRLQLGHYKDAYEALINNPDYDRQSDNLRDFIKTLLDGRKLKELMSFPYLGLEASFCSILKNRARTTESVNNVYYDFLFAYQMKRGKKFLRMAANVMYEQAIRLYHNHTPEALEKIVKCLLTADNCLQLVERRYAWLLRKPDPAIEELEILIQTDDKQKPDKLMKIVQCVEVVSYREVKQELALATARLRLMRNETDVLTNDVTSAEEIIIMLINAGMYRKALSLCKVFSLPYELAFESLTRQYVSLMSKSNQEAWKWLQLNDLHDLPIIGLTPSQAVENLLKYLLGRYEKPKLSAIHKVVVGRMLAMRCFIPFWIVKSYKVRNPAELLRLYFRNGIFEEAAQLAIDYLSAALGHGGEHFGMKCSVYTATTPFWMPLNLFEDIISQLDAQTESSPHRLFLKENNQLKHLFKQFLDADDQRREEWRVPLA